MYNYKFDFFCENFSFVNSVKRHICDFQKSRLDLGFAYISKRQSDFAIS